MAVTAVKFVGSPNRTHFPNPFAEKPGRITVNGVDATFTLSDGNLLAFASAPANGAEIVVFPSAQEQTDYDAQQNREFAFTDYPAHQWNGTALRFRQNTGHWGPWIDLQGPTANVTLPLILDKLDDDPALVRGTLHLDRSAKINSYMIALEDRDPRPAVARMIALGFNNLELENDGQEFVFPGPWELPDNSRVAGGAFYSTSAPFRIWSGNGAKIRRTDTTGNPYVIGHAGFHQTNLTNQNSYLSIEGLHIAGPGARSGVVGIGLANTSFSRIAHCVIEGCDAMVELWAHGAGGCQGNTIEGVSSPFMVYSGGYDFATVLARCNRRGIALNGGVAVAGRVQDTRIIGCNLNNVLVTGIDTRGHGAALGSSGSATGGCVNVVDVGSRIYSDAGDQLVATTVDHADNAHTVYLPKGGTFINATANQFANCVLRVRDATGRFHYAWIDAFEDAGSTWRCVLASDYSLTPTAGLQASICYGDGTARTLFQADELQHAIYYEMANDSFFVSSGLYTELMRPAVVHPNANRSLTFINPTFNVRRSRGVVRHRNSPTDPTIWEPEAGVGGVSSLTAGTTGVIHGSMWKVGDPLNSNLGEFAQGFSRQNKTGAALTHGACIASRGIDYHAGISADYTTSGGAIKHVPVWAPGDTIIQPDEWFETNEGGRQKILLEGTGNHGDLIMPKAGQVWQAVPRAGISAEDLSKARGELLTGKPDAGVGLVMADIW